jgi:hypothetical protein
MKKRKTLSCVRGVPEGDIYIEKSGFLFDQGVCFLRKEIESLNELLAFHMFSGVAPNS